MSVRKVLSNEIARRSHVRVTAAVLVENVVANTAYTVDVVSGERKPHTWYEVRMRLYFPETSQPDQVMTLRVGDTLHVKQLALDVINDPDIREAVRTRHNELAGEDT